MAYKDPEKAKAWREANKERRREYMKEYNKSHKEEKRKYDAEYRKTHKEEIASKRKEWNNTYKNKDPQHFAELNRKKALKFYYAHHEECLKRANFKNRYGVYRFLDTDHYVWEDVEGFDGWTVNVACHHRLEELGFSVKELKARGLYYNRPADELVCLTHSEHKRRHCEAEKKLKKILDNQKNI